MKKKFQHKNKQAIVANNTTSVVTDNKEATARGSGLEAVAALRRRQTNIPESSNSSEQVSSSSSISAISISSASTASISSSLSSSSSKEEDDLDRRANELLQRCDAMLTTGGSPEPKSVVSPLSVVSPGSSTTTTTATTATVREKMKQLASSGSSETLEHEKEMTPEKIMIVRTEEVLANADRLLSTPKLPVTIKRSEREQQATRADLEKLIRETVSCNLFGTALGGHGWQPEWTLLHGYMGAAASSPGSSSYMEAGRGEERALERLEKNLKIVSAH